MWWGSALWRLLLLLCLVASSLLVMGSSSSLAGASSCWGNEAVPAARLPAEFCGWVWAEGLAEPRGVEAVSNGDVLVLERALAQVTALFDTNGDGHSDPQERAVIAKAPDINHAILVHEGYLYASSASTVYRWKYQPGQRAPLGDYIVVVRDIPTCCDHVTRTILFDKENRLYIQLGSGSNVDPDSRQARIHRWNATAIPDGGFVWNSGELFADGLRNEVGLRNDKFGRIWGVENGIDNLYRQSLGGDIHNNNPSEELNLFLPERPGMFYGYPYCWSQFNLTFGKPGTQWVTNEFLNDTIHSDAWCQNRTNVEPPALNMPAHYAPLDIIFYDKSNGAFPASLDGDAFVACHGSWDRDVPAGYKVLHVIFNQETGQPIDYRPFFEYRGPGDTGPDWPHRPVGLTFGKCANAGSCLFVSSDASGSIIAIAAEAHVLLKE